MKGIKIARIKKDLTQPQLGKIVEMSGSTISRIERGKQPLTVEMLNKLAIALEVPINELLEGDN